MQSSYQRFCCTILNTDRPTQILTNIIDFVVLIWGKVYSKYAAYSFERKCKKQIPTWKQAIGLVNGGED